MNRKKDYKDGRFLQAVSNALDMKLRDNLERLKKIKNHQGGGWTILPSYFQGLGFLECDQIGLLWPRRSLGFRDPKKSNKPECDQI